MSGRSASPRRGTMAAPMADVQRTGLALRDPLPWHDFAQVVRTAEEAGYAALFVPEIAGREAFSTLAGVAGATERIGLSFRTPTP